MRELPSGTVAFLFTDIEGSTTRWERDSAGMMAAVERHLALLGRAIEARHGVHFKTVGDAVQAAFFTVPDAVAAALAAQLDLTAEPWGTLGPLRVRMAIHVGVAEPRNGDYLAPALNRLARLLAVGHGGQILLTQAAANLVRDSLPDQAALRTLGEHRLRDLQHPEPVFQLLYPALEDAFPPLRSLDMQRHNLPAQPTTFVGRAAGARRVVECLLNGDTRILTLTGAGGVGKTRLALRAGEELLKAFADGVWFVDLAPVSNPDLVPQAIAGALGVREEEGRSLRESLREHLRDRTLLLLIDNFEQVVDAAPQVAELLEASPQSKALVTSRVPLRLRGERELPILPLPVAERTPGAPFSLEEAATSEAVQLFLARAQAVRPDFSLTAETAPIIAEVVTRLDGLPLAIELAAARVRLLQPRDLLARLDDRLRVLTGGPRDAPSRHQTLRQAIAWSHDLLTPEEQSLFRRLAVFAASTTLAAVEAVADPDGELDALDNLNALVEGNLVQCAREGGEEARFGILQTIRAFGLEQLVASGEEPQIRDAHARYIGSVATGARAALSGPEQGSWYDRFAAEHDDIREALRWLISQKDAEPAVRLVGIMWAFWWIRGYLTEGCEWLERVLSLGPTADPAARALALFGAGTLAEALGDLRRAVERYEEALALARTHGDDQGVARAQMALAVLAQDQGEYGEAERSYDEALRRFRAAGDEAGAAHALVGLGTLAAYRGENERAAARFTEGAKQFERLGDAWSLGLANGNLARLAFLAGQFEQATSHAEQALAIFQRLGDQANIALLLANLGEVAHRRGALDEAARLYDESLVLFRELGDRRNIASTLVTFAEVDVTRGDTSRAATLLNESLQLMAELEDMEATTRGLEAFAALAQAQGQREQGVQALGAATALREAIGMPLPLVYQPEHERLVEGARQTLGQAFDQAWETGRALSSQDAIDLAIATTASIAPAGVSR